MQKNGIALAGTEAMHAFDFAEKIRSSDTAFLSGIYARNSDEAAARFPGVQLYGSYEQLLEDPHTEGIILASEMKDHCRMILQAAEKGRALFVENGLCMDENEAYLIRKAVQENGIIFVLSDPVRKPPFLLLKQWMEKQICGSPVSLNIHMAGASGLKEDFSPAQAYIMPFSEGHGHHACAMLEWLMGKPAAVSASASAMSTGAKTHHAYDNAAAVFTYHSGVTGIIQMSALEASKPYEARVFCTAGELYASKKEAGYRHAGKEWTFVPEDKWPLPEPYILDEWVRCIHENRKPEMYGIDDAVIIAEMYSAIQKALGQNTFVGGDL